MANFTLHNISRLGFDALLRGDTLAGVGWCIALTDRATEHFLINFLSPGSGKVVVPKDFGLKNTKELHGKIDGPAPLPRCHPHLRFRKLTGERAHENLVLVGKCRQHYVLHWRF